MEQEGRQDADRVADSRWKTDAPCLKMGNFVLKMDFDEGDEYFREKARDELRETPEIVEQSLNDFRTMVKGNEIWMKISGEGGRCSDGVSTAMFEDRSIRKMR